MSGRAESRGCNSRVVGLSGIIHLREDRNTHCGLVCRTSRNPTNPVSSRGLTIAPMSSTMRDCFFSRIPALSAPAFHPNGRTIGPPRFPSVSRGSFSIATAPLSTRCRFITWPGVRPWPRSGCICRRTGFTRSPALRRCRSFGHLQRAGGGLRSGGNRKAQGAAVRRQPGECRTDSQRRGDCPPGARQAQTCRGQRRVAPAGQADVDAGGGGRSLRCDCRGGRHCSREAGAGRLFESGASFLAWHRRPAWCTKTAIWGSRRRDGRAWSTSMCGRGICRGRLRRAPILWKIREPRGRLFVIQSVRYGLGTELALN